MNLNKGNISLKSQIKFATQIGQIQKVKLSVEIILLKQMLVFKRIKNDGGWA